MQLRKIKEKSLAFLYFLHKGEGEMFVHFPHFPFLKVKFQYSLLYMGSSQSIQAILHSFVALTIKPHAGHMYFLYDCFAVVFLLPLSSAVLLNIPKLLIVIFFSIHKMVLSFGLV